MVMRNGNRDRKAKCGDYNKACGAGKMARNGQKQSPNYPAGAHVKGNK